MPHLGSISALVSPWPAFTSASLSPQLATSPHAKSHPHHLTGSYTHIWSLPIFSKLTSPACLIHLHLSTRHFIPTALRLLCFSPLIYLSSPPRDLPICLCWELTWIHLTLTNYPTSSPGFSFLFNTLSLFISPVPCFAFNLPPLHASVQSFLSTTLLTHVFF